MSAFDEASELGDFALLVSLSLLGVAYKPRPAPPKAIPHGRRRCSACRTPKSPSAFKGQNRSCMRCVRRISKARSIRRAAEAAKEGKPADGKLSPDVRARGVDTAAIHGGGEGHGEAACGVIAAWRSTRPGAITCAACAKEVAK